MDKATGEYELSVQSKELNQDITMTKYFKYDYCSYYYQYLITDFSTNKGITEVPLYYFIHARTNMIALSDYTEDNDIIYDV